MKQQHLSEDGICYGIVEDICPTCRAAVEMAQRVADLTDAILLDVNVRGAELERLLRVYGISVTGVWNDQNLALLAVEDYALSELVSLVEYRRRC